MTGISEQGVYMKTELFGSKFYCGHVVKKFPEPSISFLQGRIALKSEQTFKNTFFTTTQQFSPSFLP